MSNCFTNTRLEFHILQSFPVSCLNRDDLGSPKSALIGGVPRARVSSQCWKRAVRMQMHELGCPTAKRTKYVAGVIAEKCAALGATAEQASACGEFAAKVLDLGLKKAKEELGKKKKQDEQLELSTIAEESGTDFRSATIFFISDAESAAIANYYKEKNFEIKEKDDIVKICKSGFNPAHDGADIALFGRMAANAVELNVEAAAAFAHAISIHRVNAEFDYFTAVDDCRKEEETGSGHLGTLEFNSATYYRYVSLDLGQLAATLNTDEINSIVECFTKALFLAVPAARQATMSAACPWNYAIVTVRKGQRLQLPFTKTVAVTRENPDMVSAGIAAMKREFEAVEKLYGSLFGEIYRTEVGSGLTGIDDLLKGISETIGKIKQGE